MPRIDSRSPEIDTEKCVRVSGSGRYDMVLITAQHLRDLKIKHRTNPNRTFSSVDALKDMQEGNVDPTDFFQKIK